MANTSSFNWRLLQQWVFVCATFYLVRIIFDFISSRFASSLPDSTFIIILFFTAMSNAIGGMCQWYVLKNWISTAKYWVLATSLSFPLALSINNYLRWLDITTLPQADSNNLINLFSSHPGRIPFIIYEAMIGLIIGIAQWFVLRGKVSSAGWWIAGSSFGFVFGSFVVSQIRQILGSIGLYYGGGVYDPIHWLLTVVNGIIFGIVTGLVLVKLLSKSPNVDN
ncbi:MAG TPA: hypothetical protein VK203_29400 [Nostocaceae cyanobacterium]|nr:hypothetical protein [Nostocaceae cyanobacterium]